MKSDTSVIVIACSTGGPNVLREIVSGLDERLQVPIVIVQHMSAVFTKSLAKSLNRLSKIHIEEAKNGEILQNGRVYIAPGGKHIKIMKNLSGDSFFKVYDGSGNLKPCADILLKSLISTSYSNVTVIVLTGMGKDGTAGILLLKQSGKQVFVIAQKPEECIVSGMSKSVIELGLEDKILPAEEIAQAMMKG